MKERPAKRNKRVRKAQVISTRNTVEEGESSEEFDEGRKGNGMTMEYQSTHPMDIATTMRGELDHDMNSEEGHESMGGLGDFSPVFSFLSAQSRRIKAEEPRPSNDTSECMAGAPGESIATPSASTLPELAPHSSPSALPAATKKARSSTRHRFSSSVPIPTYTDSDLPLKTSNDDLILNYDSVPSPSNITPNHRDTSHHAPADASTSGTRELKMESITEAERQLDLPLARASYGRKIVEDQATAESTVGFLESLRAQALASVNVTSTSKSVYVRPIKSSYERPITTPLKGSNLVAAFPLSAVAKGRSLPKKLELALPEDESLFENSARLYSPAMLSNTGVIPVGSGPTESTLYGFWPAPPPLNTGKGLYPAPLIRQEEMTAVENDHRPRVEIFVDNSNIMYSFLNWLRTRPEVQLSSYDGTTANSGVQGKLKLAQLITIGGKKVRMDYTTLFAILERGRKVERRVLVGSSPLWQGLDSAIEWGYEVSILQRVPRSFNILSVPTRIKPDPSLSDSASDSNPEMPGRNGHQSTKRTMTKPVIQKVTQLKEQAVDELLHMKILESLLDFVPPPTTARPTLVLATGDANASEFNPAGFLGCVRRALERGWDVEIIAFPMGTSNTWISEMARADIAADAIGDGSGQRGRLKVIDLESFAEELVL